MTPRASTEPPHLGHLETGAVQSLQLEFRNFDISTLHAKYLLRLVSIRENMMGVLN